MSPQSLEGKALPGHPVNVGNVLTWLAAGVARSCNPGASSAPHVLSALREALSQAAALGYDESAKKARYLDLLSHVGRVIEDPLLAESPLLPNVINHVDMAPHGGIDLRLYGSGSA